MPGSSTTGSGSSTSNSINSSGYSCSCGEGGSAAHAESLPPSTIPHFEVYNHHDYTEDKKAAMEGLATLLRTIVE
jgi:hypothetical protein